MKLHTKFKRSTLTMLVLAFALQLFAVDATYYTSLDGKSGKALFDSLKSVSSKGHSSLTYTGLWTAFKTTDKKADGTVWDMYSNCEFIFGDDQDKGTHPNECDTYNREHSLPKSWWGGAENSAYTDLFHLVPTDSKVNEKRSNYPFGEVTSPSYTSGNGSKLGPNDATKVAGYTGTVFEPIDEYKGDFARNYMGMVVRYAGSISFTTGDGASIFNTTFTSAGNYGLTTFGKNLLMKWHRQDPVSQKEIDRNNAIQTKQGNRNPFIDYPCLAEYLWGTEKDSVCDIDGMTGTFDAAYDFTYSCTTNPIITAPTTSSTINVGSTTANTQKTSSATTLKGANLTAIVNLTISGTDSALFSVSPDSTTAAIGNKGTTFTVTYTPTAVGSHTATLTISSTGATSVVVTLTGSCVVLNPPTVTASYTTPYASGTVTSYGGTTTITENGFYYDTTNGFANGTGTKITKTVVAENGTFSADMTALSLAAGTYYFKAFATNSQGTGYSTQQSFTLAKPSLTASYSEGDVVGTVTSFGGTGGLTENGIYYSTSSGLADGAGTKLTSSVVTDENDKFYVDITSLDAGTYYYKAFATNAVGTTYTTEGSFVISAPMYSSSSPYVVMGTQVLNNGTVTYSGATQRPLFVKIENLASDITLSLSGANAGAFTIKNSSNQTITSISKDAASTGVSIVVVYSGTPGDATLSLTGSGINQTITLHGI